MLYFWTFMYMTSLMLLSNQPFLSVQDEDILIQKAVVFLSERWCGLWSFVPSCVVLCVC